MEQFKRAFISTMRDEEGKAAFTDIIQPLVEENIGKLNKIIENQQTKIETLETELELLKMKDRNKTLIISGINDDNNTTPEDQVIQLCRDKLKINLHPMDIDDVFKLKQKRGKTSPIIVTFTTKRKKIEIMKTKKNLRNYAKEQIYINESLTPNKAVLFANARTLVKNKAITSAWTRDGHVFIKKTPTDTPCLVNSIDKLNKLK